jgi:hypothetical protein
MAKIIKKIVRVILIIVAVAVIVPAVMFLLLQAQEIQSFTANMIIGRFAKKTGSEISIGRVSYAMFRRIVLDDLLFKDYNGDTLLTARRVSLRIREFKPSEGVIRFGRADVYEPDFRLIQDTAGILNLNLYIQALSSDRGRDSTRKTDIRFSDIELHNGAFTLADMSDTAGVRQGSINFMDLRLNLINGKVRDLRINADSVSMEISKLAFRESGGFGIENLDMNTTIGRNIMSFRDIELSTGLSKISAEKVLLMPEDSTSWKDFINQVKFEMVFHGSVLSTEDLSYFVRPLKGISETVGFSGNLSGTVAELRGRRIEIEYSKSTMLNFDFDVSGLPDISNSYLFIDFTDMTTRAEDIERFSLPGREPLQLPVIAHDLGEVTYTGSFTGFITDFVTFGTLTTERGVIVTDLSLKPAENNTFSFKGLLRTSAVDLGYVTRDSVTFGGLWMHADIDGTMKSFDQLSAVINGVIDSVEINDYKYRNVSVEGSYGNRIWDGNVSVKDKNITMDVMGRFDLGKSMPEFDFSMNLARADLYRLNLWKSDTLFNASALLTATFRGNRIDNMDGEMRLINSTLQNSNGRLSIYDFLVTSGNDNGVPVLSLKSDFADALVRGPYTFEAIGRASKVMLSQLFPSKFSIPEAENNDEIAEADFTIDARIKKIDKLNDFMALGLSISDGTRLTGSFRSDSTEITADLRSEGITYAGTRLSNLTLNGAVRNGKMNVNLISDSLVLPDRSTLGNFSFKAGSGNDSIDLSINWDNKDGGKTLGTLSAKGFFSMNENQKPLLTVGIMPTSFTVNHTAWHVSPARIVIDSASAYFDNILLNSRDNYIGLEGRLSPDPSQKLLLSFKGLNLSYLNNIINRNSSGNSSSSFEMDIHGIMDGNVTFSDVYKDFLFESNINVNDFKVNENNYGVVTVRSEWDPRNKAAAIHVVNDLEGSRYFNIDGDYFPSTKSVDLLISTFDMPLDIINPLIKTFASGMRGTGTGSVRLSGNLRELSLRGAVMADKASLKVDFLQTRYSFSDSIRFTPRGIVFRDIRIYDERNHAGTINGMLSHHSFKDIGINFDINMENMLVMNTRPKDNDIFYGTAYATGYAGIRGNEDKIAFNISARTTSNTEFFIPLTSAMSVSDYPYITFIGTGQEEKTAATEMNMFTKQEEASKIELNFDLEVTPEAKVQLIMDATAGGLIRGTGSGKLNISLNSNGDVKMAGDYVINDGEYLFTLGNILNKRFIVEQGGTISWNGDIDDADLDIKAIYRTKASLSEIYSQDGMFPELQERLPVECLLNLTGKLLNPVIKFDIQLPTADDRTREYLRMAIDNEEKLSKQFLYLLVMNSFYSDPALYSASSTSGTQNAYTQTEEASVLGVNTTTEMLSNQLSNWLSQISNDFDIGFNYRPGNEITPQEVEVALSTQLLNDRVTLNGNVDVGGTQAREKTSGISGEFTIEFKLTDMLRFKVFNRSNNNLFYEVQHPYTQGVGIFYRRDFDTLKDFFIAPENKRRKKVTSDEETGKE